MMTYIKQYAAKVFKGCRTLFIDLLVTFALPIIISFRLEGNLLPIIGYSLPLHFPR